MRLSRDDEVGGLFASLVRVAKSANSVDLDLVLLLNDDDAADAAAELLILVAVSELDEAREVAVGNLNPFFDIGTLSCSPPIVIPPATAFAEV